jgi:phosphoglycolate phosphatase
VVPVINLEWIQKLFRDKTQRGYSTEAVTDTILRRMPDYLHYICPQFNHTHVNFQRVPIVDTSNPFTARTIPTADESMVVIRFAQPKGIDFQYLLSMIHDSWMSRANTIVVPGGKMELAMQLIFTAPTRPGCHLMRGGPMDFHYDLVMFDLDGTLVETAPEISDAVNDTLRDLGLPAADEAQVERWIGHGTRELLIAALASATATDVQAVRASDSLPSTAAVFDKHYQRRCGTRSRLYPGVREALARLRASGVKLAVITNKEARYTETVLAVHRLQDSFDRVISGDSLPTKKPDPACVQACLQAFDVPRTRALFVGDSSIDAATARNAGVAVWLLPHGYNMGAPIEQCQPDRVVADFSVLVAAA